MAYKVILSAVASKNLEDALDYYSGLSNKKVALDFLKDYRSVYKALRINPFYQIHDTNYRFIPFKKFSYIAFFIVDEPNKKVYINAIFHTAQDPNKYSKD